MGIVSNECMICMIVSAMIWLIDSVQLSHRDNHRECCADVINFLIALRYNKGMFNLLNFYTARHHRRVNNFTSFETPSIERIFVWPVRMGCFLFKFWIILQNLHRYRFKNRFHVWQSCSNAWEKHHISSFASAMKKLIKLTA